MTRDLVPESVTDQNDRVPAPGVGIHLEERSPKGPSRSEEFIPHKAREEGEAIVDAARHLHRHLLILVRVLALQMAEKAGRR